MGVISDSGDVTVLLNNSAGRGTNHNLRGRLAAVFAEAGVPAHIETANSGADLSRLAAKAARGSDDLIVAGGGDGTVSTVAAAVVGTGKTLGVLPLGTLNHFAKDVGIPLALADAARALIQGSVKEVDVGEVNGRIFVNNSSIGLYPEIVRRRNKEQEIFNRGKWHALCRASLAALRSYKFVRVHVRTREEEFFRTTPFVFVGNNPYNLDRFGIGGREAVDKGQLCFWLARKTRPLGLVRLGLRALVGLLRGARDFEAHCGSEFEVIPLDRKVRVAVDGETCEMEAPLRYRSRPRALRVMVPQKEEPA